MLKPGIFRVITGPFRVLPDFLIIGASKCGTTSLYNYLIQHPNIYPAKTKEVNYFGRHSSIWYRPNFPTVFLKYIVTKLKKEPFMTGEASPFYLLNPLVPRIVKKKIPNVKLIVLLRNPIDRTFSQYKQIHRDNQEPFSFEEALKKEKFRTKEDWENLIENGLNGNRDHAKYSYLSGSLYYEQIKTWMDLFPREQFLILKSEDFFENPSKITSLVLEFLELPNFEINVIKKYNVGDYQEIDESNKKYLAEFLKPHNEKLYKLLGRNFNWN